MKSVLSFFSFFLASALPALASVMVTSPTNSVTVSSPVQYVATASSSTCSAGVASMGIYVNNQRVVLQSGASLNASLTLANGTYNTVVQEWDKCGGSTTSAVNITVSSTTSTTTAVVVSSPVNNSTVTSPVTFSAKATTASCASGIAAVGVYVNNTLAYKTNGSVLQTALAISTGLHQTVVQAWDNCGGAIKTPVTITVGSGITTTVGITASPASISPGSSSVLTVTASNADSVAISGSDGSSYVVSASGGTLTVTPKVTTTYTATATGATEKVTGAATVAVASATSTLAISPNPAAVALGATRQLTATATAKNGSTTNVTSTASWSVANATVASVSSSGLITPLAAGATTITALSNGVSASVPLTVTIAPGTGTDISTWQADTLRSGLNATEASLSPSNVSTKTFGKLFAYAMDGYEYGEPLLISNLTIKNVAHNVVYAATEHDSVYAFDADNYGTGAPLWQTSLLQANETPLSNGAIKPYQGVTSTPVIDTATNTIYVVSAQVASGQSGTFRLNALDITTGAQKPGSPVTIQASAAGTNSDSVDGYSHLTTSCVQRAALMLNGGTVYIGFGGCHSGWLLAYDAQKLTQVGLFNASPNQNGEGPYASAGGVWMGSGGPVADSAGNVYITTGNGPWDGKTAFSDSVIKFSPTLQMLDYFTPNDYAYMDCNDADLAAGGLLMIPGSTHLLAGGKTGRLYMVNSGNLGKEQANDAGVAQELYFESDLSAPYSTSCTDSTGTHTTDVNSYEIFGTAAYYNGSVYLGVTPTAANAPAGIRQFTYSGGTLTPYHETTPSVQESSYGTTPFISASGTSNGVLWMIDHGIPLQSGSSTAATLRAYDANDLSNELYNSATNSGDAPGYGIKFTSPIVGNGKVYMSSGHDLTTVTNPQGELDVYGLH